MLCHQCGSPVDAGDASCPNCGAELQTTKRLKLSDSRGLRISQELKAVKLEAQHFPPGEAIDDRYVLGEMIGKGPFGEVYRARDNEIEVDVALKVFDQDVVRNPRDREVFLNTTRAARALTQPNVVRVLGSGFHKDHPWVAMQHLEGLSLRKVLDLRRAKKEHFQLDELEPIVSQITLALQHVSREFPHGDLKPENVIFLPDLLKVTDAFILASLPAETIIPRLKDSAYLAPELHTEQTEPDVRADVYSVGVIIGEMIFGADYTPGSQGDGEFAPIDALVKRATAFDPKERYPTVEALSEDLATLVDTGALLAPDAKNAPPPPPTAAAPPPAPAPAGPAGGPPVPPTGPAPIDPIETAATVEVNRGIENDLQDAILTEEVKRDQLPPKRRTNTATAAVPKPSRPIPQPRKSDGNSTTLVVAVIIALIGFGLALVWAQRDTGDVEHIGQQPEELGNTTTTAKAGETTGTANAELAANNASTTVSKAQTAAAVATTTNNAVGQTAAQTAAQPSEAAAVAAAATNDGAREPQNDAKSTGSKKPAAEDAKPARATGTDCPSGMVLVKSKKNGNVCVDRYEYPGGGVVPRTRVSWFQAKKLCEAKGKRLCELKEWRSACGSRYPYGGQHDPNRCNTADEDGFERSLGKTGAFKRCRSRSGANDMVGNAHEWVAEQRIAGGGFESDEEVGSCRYSSPKSPASSASYIGFRCCANPQ